METERFDLIDIEAGERLRAIDPKTVELLKGSIREIGLQALPAVRLRRDDAGELHIILVSGAHRVEALRQLGHDFVDCIVIPDNEDDACLWEIDENLARAELTDAQRADHHARREGILKRKGLVTTNGGDRKSERQNVGLKSYARATAEQLGVDERTVQRDLARGKKIAPEVLADVAGTELDKGVVLDELARVPRTEQPARLDEIRQRREAEKLNREHNRVIALTEAQQYAHWLLARTDLNELNTLISWIEGTKPKDVIAALRREAA